MKSKNEKIRLMFWLSLIMISHLHNSSFQVLCYGAHIVLNLKELVINLLDESQFAKLNFYAGPTLWQFEVSPVVWWINSTVLHWQLLSRRPESCREKHFSKLDSDGFFALLRSLSYVIKAIVAIYMYLEKNIWCLSYSLRMKNCIWILKILNNLGLFLIISLYIVSIIGIAPT